MSKKRGPTPWSEFQEVETPQDERVEGVRTFRNSRYMVTVIPTGGGIEWLQIKRLKKETIHDWREILRIKNELTHPEREAFEMYPAMQRVVDTANSFHLFVLPLGVVLNVGWKEGEISERVPDRYEFNKGRQRPLPAWMGERPARDPDATHAPFLDPTAEDGSINLTTDLRDGLEGLEDEVDRQLIEKTRRRYLPGAE